MRKYIKGEISLQVGVFRKLGLTHRRLKWQKYRWDCGWFSRYPYLIVSAPPKPSSRIIISLRSQNNCSLAAVAKRTSPNNRSYWTLGMRHKFDLRRWLRSLEKMRGNRSCRRRRRLEGEKLERMNNMSCANPRISFCENARMKVFFID